MALRRARTYRLMSARACAGTSPLPVSIRCRAVRIPNFPNLPSLQRQYSGGLHQPVSLSFRGFDTDYLIGIDDAFCSAVASGRQVGKPDNPVWTRPQGRDNYCIASTLILAQRPWAKYPRHDSMG